MPDTATIADVDASELYKAEAAQVAAFRRWEAKREARNAAVRQAISDGMTHAQIARATGLTRSRVGQIALTQPNES